MLINLRQAREYLEQLEEELEIYTSKAKKCLFLGSYYKKKILSLSEKKSRLEALGFNSYKFTSELNRLSKKLESK